jgi:hypothetical protein
MAVTGTVAAMVVVVAKAMVVVVVVVSWHPSLAHHNVDLPLLPSSLELIANLSFLWSPPLQFARRTMAHAMLIMLCQCGRGQSFSANQTSHCSQEQDNFSKISQYDATMKTKPEQAQEPYDSHNDHNSSITSTHVADATTASSSGCNANVEDCELVCYLPARIHLCNCKQPPQWQAGSSSLSACTTHCISWAVTTSFSIPEDTHNLHFFFASIFVRLGVWNPT